MTYLQFLLVFIVPAIVVGALLARGARSVWGRRAVWTVPVLALIAFVYTTPWDNYLVYRGVWWYGPDRVLGTIGYVPVEEYLFFLLQPVMTGLFTMAMLLRFAAPEPDAGRTRTLPQTRTTVTAREPQPVRPGLWGGVAVGYGAAAAAGAVMLFAERTLYMGLILAWAAPVLLGQWLLAGDALLRRGRAAVLALAVPTLYLWVADRIAIGSGIWSIAAEYTTGVHLLGLPIEEAMFFLVTNVLVVQGMMLFLYPSEVRMPGRAPRPSPARTRTAV